MTPQPIAPAAAALPTKTAPATTIGAILALGAEKERLDSMIVSKYTAPLAPNMRISTCRHPHEVREAASLVEPAQLPRQRATGDKAIPIPLLYLTSTTAALFPSGQPATAAAQDKVVMMISCPRFSGSSRMWGRKRIGGRTQLLSLGGILIPSFQNLLRLVKNRCARQPWSLEAGGSRKTEENSG